MAKLQDTLDKMFGQLNIAQTQLPEYFETGLNPSKRLRPYQEECMKYFLTYMNPDKTLRKTTKSSSALPYGYRLRKDDDDGTCHALSL